MIVRIVEDSTDIAHLLRTVLEMAEGMQVIYTTHDFERLISKDAWQDVDAALVDIHLATPNLTGLDILRFLKGFFPNIRRVVLTAGVPVDERVRDMADRVLIKPSSSTEIIDALKEDIDAN